VLGTWVPWNGGRAVAIPSRLKIGNRPGIVPKVVAITGRKP